VILISTETKEDGAKVYEMRGLMVEYFLLSILEINVTVVFIQPLLERSFETIMREATQLTAGIADFVFGTFPLLPI
jgi:hypothetical protein